MRLALALLALLAGCAPQITCPLGTYQTRIDTDSETEGQAAANASVPSASGSATGAWRGRSSVDWVCRRLCGRGTLLRAREERGVRTVECVSASAPATVPPVTVRDGGPR